MSNKSKKGSPWLQTLLMSVIGTTISIILTFGTSSILDSRKKKAEGRQMAMMVIHDIDNTIESFRAQAREEEENFKMSQYVMNHLDSLESIGKDTLETVLSSLLGNDSDKHFFDDSSEKVFLSSQDSWKNIDNATFIDVVQEFYQKRRTTYDSINTGIIWDKPVSEDSYYRAQMASHEYQLDAVKYLSEKLRLDQTRFYIDCSPARQRAYNQLADSFGRISDRCKFLMGITDAEMQGYIAARERPGRQVKDKNMVGKWMLRSSADLYQGFEFGEDHTIRTIIIQHYMDPFFSGRLDLQFNYHGTWELKGDSLITNVSTDFDYQIDTGGIRYLPEKKAYVENLLKSVDESVAIQRSASLSGKSERQAYRVAIDPSGDRIEMVARKDDTEIEYYILRER